ncbi:MAG: hypothetical protein ACI8ZM_004978 [Crocinitomix sp.]|jgi:hypothetical protein
MKKLILMFLGIVLFSGVSIAQAFQQSLSVAGIDFNHYSIETTDSGYACVGTLFDAANGNNDIHVFMVNQDGDMMWERVIDESADDRGLDIVFNNLGKLAITGYISPGGVGFGELYVATLDLYGNLIDDQAVSGFSSSAGTNIIVTDDGASFIVGGLYADQFAGTVLTSNEALVIEFDPSLNYMNHVQLSTADMDYSSINDIVEIPGQGYFVTGGVGIPFGFPHYANQGVLAMFLSYSLSIQNDLSFESTNSTHVGVSAVYSSSADEIYLMSNSGINHNPQITIIGGVTSTPAITTNYLLSLDPTYGWHNAAGFELRATAWNQNHLTVCGYFRTYSDGITNGNAIPWITEIEKSSGALVQAYTWPAPSQGFSAHGDGIFSTFNGVHPTHYNQEILTERMDGQGFVLVGPHKNNGYFGIDLVTTHGMGGMPCYDPYSYSATTVNRLAISGIVSNVTPISPYTVFASANGFGPTVFSVNCLAMKGSLAPIQSDSEVTTEQGVTSLNELNEVSLDISPNPFNENFTVRLSGENINGHLSVRNALGQIVFESSQVIENQFFTEVNTTSFEKGIYLVVLTSPEGILITKKIVKL